MCKTSQRTSLVHQTIESNGSSKNLHGTLPRGMTQLPSGNLHHPAGLLGEFFELFTENLTVAIQSQNHVKNVNF